MRAADLSKNVKKLQQIRLPRVVGADDQVDLLEVVELDAFRVIEGAPAFDFDGFYFHSSLPNVLSPIIHNGTKPD